MAYAGRAGLGLLSETVGLLRSCFNNHEVIKFLLSGELGCTGYNTIDTLFWPLLG